jgi:hypothetical protein
MTVQWNPPLPGAGDPLVLRLIPSRKAKRKAKLTLALGVVFAGLPVALMVWGSVTVDPGGARLFIYLMTIAAVGLLWAFVERGVRFLRGTGVLMIDEEILGIDYPMALKEPWSTDRRALEAVIVDEGLGHPRARFPIVGEGWLWHRDGTVAVPALTTDERPPNMLLMLREPRLGPTVRRSDLRLPLPGEGLASLMLTVEDPGRARDRLRAMGLLRGSLTRADVDWLDRVFRGESAEPEDHAHDEDRDPGGDEDHRGAPVGIA